MLKSLHISNYALIDNIDISFTEGLNVITGETGAGKSIILGALSLILGGRADTKVLREENRKSIVEADFNISKYPTIRNLLIDNELDDNGETLTLRREITPQGRSRAFVNDTPVTLDVLKDIALQLVDIHSQHQNLLLASSDYQLQIIDALAGNAADLDEYAKLYGEYRKGMKQYFSLKKQIEASRANQEFMRFQLPWQSCFHSRRLSYSYTFTDKRSHSSSKSIRRRFQWLAKPKRTLGRGKNRTSRHCGNVPQLR